MVKWWKTYKGRMIGVAVTLLIAGALIAPAVLWRLAPSRPMDVTVVDKTVPRPNFRKHAGLFWALRHEKIVQRSNNRPFVDSRDYAGYHPAARGAGTIVPIPERPADLTYLVDTYGVYADDLTARPRGVRSTGLYGGLSAAEVDTILRNVRPGGTLVGEFNCIGTPTAGAARERLSAALGVRWTGWIGRHFAYLDLTSDLPEWIPDTWRRQTGKRWQFRGPGYVFVNEAGYLVVLVEGVDTPMEPLTLRVDAAHAKEFGTVREVRYDGWVEIMEPRAGAEVLATYELELTPSGRTKMLPVPIAGRWPAAIRTRSDARTSYYFAGDYADRTIAGGAYRYRWLPRFKRLTAPGDRDNMERFFWGIYVPMMQTILRDTETNVRR